MPDRLLSTASLAMLALAASAGAQPPAGDRAIQSSARFVNTTVGFWELLVQPELATQPSLARLTRTDPPAAAADFALSFNCAVKSSGKLSDCRLTYSAEEMPDTPALVRTLARQTRLTPASARLARDKAYRVTIDIALDTKDAYGMPKECRPPFCSIELASPPPPPPPPPTVQDPVLAAALRRFDSDIEAAQDRSRVLGRAAEDALRNRGTAPAGEAERAQVLAYVNSRHAVIACTDRLREAAKLLPLGRIDRGIVADRLKLAKSFYDSGAQNERVILVGLLDPAAATAEAAIP